MLLAKSNNPVAVLVGSPISPLPRPLKKPAVPSWLAPSIGAVAIPEIPEDIPSTKDVAPDVNPTDILQEQRPQTNWSVVDVSNGHCQDIEHHSKSVLGLGGVLGVDAFGSHKRKIELQRLQVQNLEVKIVSRTNRWRLWNLQILVPKNVANRLVPGSTREFRKVQQCEQEVLVNLDRHLLQQHGGILDVIDTMGLVL
ncbi:hypothetical protein OGAPHI_004386 [Ogataea philodendri]|uniref:Uncharacterized protein n=1 Tax=Ogataea philodendri TaxID=1378263 RepID=A0A9P8P6K1_9ASCO|nr:uncharacterized protein OGAPHI_004386 [Ogataea philodendri]KAH3666197.1 hypothetical protein OGAPHI_004386 [Ogataea philodendri]